MYVQIEISALGGVLLAYLSQVHFGGEILNKNLLIHHIKPPTAFSKFYLQRGK